MIGQTRGLSGVVVALALGVLVAALALGERAGLQRALRLRARALVALAIGAFGGLGCVVVGLNAVFAAEALATGSPEAGYAKVGGLQVDADQADRLIFILVPVVTGLAAVSWARLCHAGLRRQTRSVLLTCWVGPAILAVAIEHLRAAWPWEALVLWAKTGAPALLLLLAIHGLERLEQHLGLEAIRPRPLPAGSHRRVLAVLAAAALTLGAIHGALTLRGGLARERALDALRARGEPLSLADLGPAPPDEDAWPCFEQALSSYRRWWGSAAPPRVRAGATAEELAQTAAVHSRSMESLERWLGRSQAALDQLAEAARRPRRRLGPRDRSAEEDAATHLLEARVRTALWRGDAARAVETIELRLTHAAALEPEVEGLMAFWSQRAAFDWIVSLLESGEPSAADCRRLLERLRTPPSWDLVLRAVRGHRLRLLERRGAPEEGPLAARLPWVRDHDLLAALAHLDRAAEAFARRAPFPRSTEHAEPWRPLSADAEAATNSDPQVHAVWVHNRAIVALALALRLHRLEVGAYPATLAELRDAPRVPDDVTYAPDGQGGFVLTGKNKGWLLPLKIPR